MKERELQDLYLHMDDAHWYSQDTISRHHFPFSYTTVFLTAISVCPLALPRFYYLPNIQHTSTTIRVLFYRLGLNKSRVVDYENARNDNIHKSNLVQ